MIIPYREAPPCACLPPPAGEQGRGASHQNIGDFRRSPSCNPVYMKLLLSTKWRAFSRSASTKTGIGDTRGISSSETWLCLFKHSYDLFNDVRFLHISPNPFLLSHSFSIFSSVSSDENHSRWKLSLSENFQHLPSI